MSEKDIIIGSGFTGLAAGIKTDFPIYERGKEAGGICRSYRLNGFHFENGGGHWIFGGDEVRDFISHFSNITDYERNASVYINQMMPYPIQNYLKQEHQSKAGSMKDWMLSNFTPELNNIFFMPFNEKYTAGTFDDIVQDDPLKTPKKGSGYNCNFFYPDEGLDVVADRMADLCDIRFNKELTHVDLKDRRAYFADGEVVEYGRIISTIPLRSMLDLCSESPNDYKENLPYTSVLCLNIGAERTIKTPVNHWVYIPSKEQEFFRVGFYSNIDKNMSPDGTVGIYVERAIPHGHKVESDELYSYSMMVLHTLRNWGWIGQDVCIDFQKIPYAYTWLVKTGKREQYIEFLKSHNIESIGRYGKWRFQGIAESLTDGLSVI